MNDIAEVPEHELGDAAIPGGATVWGEAAGPGLGLGRKEAGTGQRNYSVIKIFNTLFPSLTTRQNKDVLLCTPHSFFHPLFRSLIQLYHVK